jgi:hypothetical protein
MIFAPDHDRKVGSSMDILYWADTHVAGWHQGNVARLVQFE